uniref:RNA-directed RNA polymerase n=1 Tax=Leviviridae sp. TaxID=2027243 RepID=A0A514D395_9VIRU|nr:MAG: RNA-dependent RNA polymerase [Leviviridae sp.]
MKSLVELLEHLLHDCGRKSAASVLRDVETLRERVEHEGDSFITISLPSFCRDFERSLDERRVSPGSFASFKKKKGSKIPAFLQGFLSHVFGSDGALLPKPRVDCIRSVRQVCLFGKKIERTCSKERVVDATLSFKQCDAEVADEAPTDELWMTAKKVASVILRALPLSQGPFMDTLIPRHGPGATREHISGNQKWRFSRWHERLEEVGFTYDRFGRASNLATAEDLVSWPYLVPPEDEEPVRVVFVPKTLRSPRVIAVEPVCMQYAQQALSRLLVRQLEDCRFTAGHMNFSDQTVNQVLSQIASGDGRYATLDMSEASDRVSKACVHDLLSAAPVFRRLVMAARSQQAQTPDGEVIPLKKFASMGSALCFPMEALMFFTSIIASRLNRAGVRVTHDSVHTFGRDVFVYGDDLIVPVSEAAAICDDLESLGLKVNRHKSFWTGKFRESCGVDCYDSVKVTPVYLRRDPPADRADVHGLLSAIATANQLFQADYTKAAAALREAVEDLLGKLPEVPTGSPACGWQFHSEESPRRRWNRDLQRAEMLAWVPTPLKQADPLDGDAALAKCIRMVGQTTLDPRDPTKPIPVPDGKHLSTSVRPYGLALKRRWVPIHQY